MENIKIVDEFLLDKLSEEAKNSPRWRKNYNFHECAEDPIQRLLNAIEPDTYIRPHKHESPDKREVFVLLKGKMALLIFDENGEITEVITFDSKNILLVEIPPATWHSLISLQENTVYFEIKDGPYNAENDKNFALWSPDENTPEAVIYLDKLKKRMNLFGKSNLEQIK